MGITIITVCFNSEKTIRETLESVLDQDYCDYEHLIIDGASSDHTMAVINEYKEAYNGRLRVISEKDNGLYDAMNKGVAHASGEIIGFLNSDDKFADQSALRIIMESFEKKDCDGIYGNLEFRDSKTMETVTRVWKSAKGNYKCGWHPAHPTLYLKKHIYQAVGKFDLNYRICSDYDFMLRMMKRQFKLVYIDRVLIHMRSGGVSTNGLTGYMKNFKESYKVLKKNGIPFALGVNLLRTGKTLCQMLNSKSVSGK